MSFNYIIYPCLQTIKWIFQLFPWLTTIIIIKNQTFVAILFFNKAFLNFLHLFYFYFLCVSLCGFVSPSPSFLTFTVCMSRSKDTFWQSISPLRHMDPGIKLIMSSRLVTVTFIYWTTLMAQVFSKLIHVTLLNIMFYYFLELF